MWRIFTIYASIQCIMFYIRSANIPIFNNTAILSVIRVMALRVIMNDVYIAVTWHLIHVFFLKAINHHKISVYLITWLPTFTRTFMYGRIFHQRHVTITYKYTRLCIQSLYFIMLTHNKFSLVFFFLIATPFGEWHCKVYGETYDILYLSNET